MNTTNTQKHSTPVPSPLVVDTAKQVFWQRWWPFTFALLTLGLLIWQQKFVEEALLSVKGYFDYVVNDAAKGWNISVDENRRTHLSRIEPKSIGSIFLGLSVLLAYIGIIALLNWAHYKYLYKALFLKRGIGYTVLYVLWLVIIWRTFIEVDDDDAAGFSAQSIGFATVSVGFCVISAFIRQNREAEKRESQLLQQKTQAELDSLKAQVNPHFLFNSLNNIYGTALGEDSLRTAESIRQLADIVRYVMEESRKDTTDVGRELRFLDDYVELHRMRIPRQDNIKILIETHWDEAPAQILPLLLNPLIENAFKYGISMQHPCFVNIRLFVENQVLTFTAENSIVLRKTLEKGTGLGLDNVRKRLALAYPGRHTFEAGPTGSETFRVNLRILL